MYSKVQKLIFLLPLLFFLTTKVVFASVLINEISPTSEDGVDIEWVELFNDGQDIVELTGYRLTDGNSNTSDDIALSGTLPGGGYLVFEHAKGWLNDGGDTLTLYNNASPSAVVDQHTYPSVSSSTPIKVVARIPNGSSTWEVTTNQSRGVVNPSPAPTATATPNPTSTPTPSATSTPTPTPKPTPVRTATPRPTATEEALPEQTDIAFADEDTQEVVLGVSAEVSPSPNATTNQKKDNLSTEKKQNVLLPVILITLGIGVVGVSGLLFWRERYNGSHA